MKMGQQQLLLIVVGLIIVGIATVVGINVFATSAVNAKRDNVISDLLHLASEAQRYYKTPKEMGGGSRGFTGWVIPKSLATNENGNFTVATQADNVVITGIGNELVLGTDSVEVQMTVTGNSFTTNIIH
jgi:Tfp pilus assembly protein PilE